MHPSSILRVFGIVCLIKAFWMLAPLVFAIASEEHISQHAFAVSLGVSLFIGVTALLTTNRVKIALGKRDLAILIPIIATTATILGALPLYLGGSFQPFFYASFEALSGLTTTGMSLHPKPELLSQSELLWRAILQWMGGYSTLILVIWALPYLGFGGALKAAKDGHEKHNLFPQSSFKKTLITLLTVYLVISIVCALSLFVSGLPLFESVCYAMSTVSTGGFLVESDSPLESGNRAVEIVIMLFMVLGAMNFVIHGKALSGSLRNYLQDQESQNFLILILLSACIAVAIVDDSTKGILNFYNAMMQIISIVTTTGYPSPQPDTFIPDFYFLLLLFLAALGGSGSSTSGGFKIARLTFFLQQSKQELYRLIHPHSVTPINYGGHSISTDSMKVLSVFSISFIGLISLLTAFLSLNNIEFPQAITLAIATVTNNGPNIIEISEETNFLLELPWVAQLGLMLGMLMGRLEILCVLVLLNFSFWRN